MLTIVTLLGFGLAFAKQIDWVFELMRARTILRIIWVGGLVTSFLPGMLVCMGMRTWRRILALTIYWLLLPVAWAWGLFWAMAPHRLGDLVVTEIVATCWVAAVGAVVCSWVLRASGLRLASLPWSVEKRWLKRR